MNILGIDPGSIKTGFGVIEANKLKLSYVASGCIVTSGDFNNKIFTIFDGIVNITRKYNIDIAVVERVFMRPDRPNPDSAIKLGHARGAIISALGMANIKIVEYSPNQIKKSVVGRGHADKEMVLFMIQTLLKLSKKPQKDASDAIAAAVCHAYHLL